MTSLSRSFGGLLRTSLRAGFATGMMLLGGVMLLCGVMLLGGATAARAQRNVDIERFRPAPDADGLLSMPSSRAPGHLRLSAAWWTSYAKDPLELDDRALVGERIGTNLVLQLGIGGRASIDLDLPLVLYQRANTTGLMGSSIDGSAIDGAAAGDPRLRVRYRVYGEPSDREGRPDGFGLAVAGTVSVGVGAGDQFAGEEQVTTNLELISDFRLAGAGAGIVLGWRSRPQDRVLPGVTLRDELHWGFGFAMPLPSEPRLQGLFEVRGQHDARRIASKSRLYVEGNIGARFSTEQVSLTAAVGTGFTDGVGTPAVRALFAIAYAPSVKDTDGDGVPDEQDQCPRLAEDRDGFEDEDGCLDPDNDNDFVLDDEDRCPNEEAIEGRDEDEDGCTDPLN